MNYTDIIIKPLMTEKSSQLTDGLNTYCFEVIREANKNQIKGAIEKLFDVKVLNVNTLMNSSKTKKFGRFMSKVAGNKKAYVQIEQGQKIELFKSI